MASQAPADSTSPPGVPSPAIETDHLRREYGEVVAVNDLALTVDRGVIFGLLGPNGAGKSTTIKMLTTLLPPTRGSARVAGFDVVRDAAEVRRRIGYVPQLLSADGGLTGRENLTLSAKLYRLPRPERGERIRTALAFMELEAAADHLVRTYSGGMIRRLELAQAMLHQPQVLFLDEPTIGLDPVARLAVWERLRDLRGRGGITILLTTHDMEEADELCDHLVIMHQGVVALAGRPADLKAGIGEGATLDDVFIQSVGGAIGEGGSYRDVRRLRSTARRLG
ncbi:MAG TPA: ATP-binding cassette domain-containing protein [Gemmatimonadales bacterium]|jgi:ABC-2 type transport system ATP-binding protein|nr:ATP-binding cassette domain-containing protein [Gemmatimonadales bacterium]